MVSGKSLQLLLNMGGTAPAGAAISAMQPTVRSRVFAFGTEVAFRLGWRRMPYLLPLSLS